MRKNTAENFWKKIEIRHADECWLWQGAKQSEGYGFFRWEGHVFTAHRFMWELFFGKIPVVSGYHGMCVLHSCDNRWCVNPYHLFLGTQCDNMKDMARKKRANSGSNKKLSSNEVDEIKKLLQLPKASRISLRKIAAQYHVSHNTIWQIDHEIAWKDV